jgi:hypothetical protein
MSKSFCFSSLFRLLRLCGYFLIYGVKKGKAGALTPFYVRLFQNFSFWNSNLRFFFFFRNALPAAGLNFFSGRENRDKNLA